MSRRVRVVVSGLHKGRFVLDEDASRYVGKVHRLRAGQHVELFDPESGLCAERARIIGDRLPHCELEIDEVREAPAYEMSVTLLVAVGKNDKPEQAVRDATALGADEVVFVQTERSVAKSSGQHRSDRLARVAQQVARQCERGRLPRILGPLAWSEVLHKDWQQPFICAFTEDAEPVLRAIQSSDLEHRLTLFVGPEGGFSDAEVESARAAGFRPVSLGPYVLRAESAYAFSLAVIRAAWLAR